MGLHRNLIHPRFGSFVLLGTVLTDAELEVQPGVLAGSPDLRGETTAGASGQRSAEVFAAIASTSCPTFSNPATSAVVKAIPNDFSMDTMRRMWLRLSHSVTSPAVMPGEATRESSSKTSRKMPVSRE